MNDAIVNYVAQELPFGGTGESGLGVRHSAKGIQKYCKSHSILVTRRAPKREPHFFPFTKRTTGMFEKLVSLQYKRVPKKYR